ncbi:hypothetical protein PF011_g30165, partial [Phytophthora fragariae]
MNDDWREDGSLKGLNAGGGGGKARGKGKGPQFTRVIPKFLQKYDQPPAIQANIVHLGYRSALVDVYRAKLLEMDPQLDTELRRVLEGYEKVINSLKKRGLMKINEGKRQLKLSGFELLALKLMTIRPVKKGQTWPTVLFGWSFFVLMWNLMSRADSIDTIMLQHIEWTDDCLVIEEQGHK